MTNGFEEQSKELTKQEQLASLLSQREELMFLKKENADSEMRNQIEKIDSEIKKLEES
ncbi:hypothetical protein [Ectobacillus panaciterrae]|uniref:hypothetical protein n=1 Tax=Ectobacillus panaciterrae TaxID=363872 RepID=UPI000409BEC5|nr:hypothetical protein [Ectobacillus panaciterrae]